MNRKTKIIVSVAAIIIVALALIGLTFGYYLTRINGNTNPKSISVSNSKLELTYSDNSSEILGNGKVIEPSNEPIGSKTFTVTNNGGDTNYSVVLEDISITNTSDNTPTTFESYDFRYTLTCKTKSGSSCNNQTTEQAIFPLTNGALISNDISKGDTHTYTLTLWYLNTEEDQSNDMGKCLNAKLNIVEPTKYNPYSNDKSSLAYNIINNAQTKANGTTFVNTPLTAIAENISSSSLEKGNEQNISINMDNIGAYASTADDAYNCYDMGECNNGAVSTAPSSCSDIINKYVFDSNMYESFYVDGCDGETPYFTISAETTISTTLDDYGTSYYFRGNVEDNYVNFAGMCWRIVRIEGDGSIKLVLEDQDEACSSTMNGNWDIPTTTGGTTKTGNFGYKYKNSKNNIDYLNGNSSSMSIAFKNFQMSNKISEITYKLKSGNWCMNDKAFARSGSSGSYTYTLLEDTSSNYETKTKFYYDSYVRLSGKTPKEPTLKCNGTKMNKFGDNTTDMYVGALTADEIVYAGATTGSSNYAYYLLNDYQRSNGESWWSLAPYLFTGYSDFALFVGRGGDLGDGSVNSNFSFRPAVSLKSGAQIISGDGTIENPYIIT